MNPRSSLKIFKYNKCGSSLPLARAATTTQLCHATTRKIVIETLHRSAVAENGFAIVKNVFSLDETGSLLELIESGLAAGTDGNIKTSKGETYAARNLVDLVPDLVTAWQKPVLVDLLTEILGDQLGLVRILYFDKHPNRTWTLPWHQDMTIAVKNNSLPSDNFSKPTKKSGVQHVEAPTELLEQMLTLRIHLDDVTEENGPLMVVRGSHAHGKVMEQGGIATAGFDTILVDAGEVLAMRPLISHASGASHAGTNRHRRILHLEFSSTPTLPDQFEWNHFFKIDHNQ